MPLRHFRFDVHLLGTEWEFIVWGGEAGYVISMGLEYFQKFLDKPM